MYKRHQQKRPSWVNLLPHHHQFFHSHYKDKKCYPEIYQPGWSSCTVVVVFVFWVTFSFSPIPAQPPYPPQPLNPPQPRHPFRFFLVTFSFSHKPAKTPHPPQTTPTTPSSPTNPSTPYITTTPTTPSKDQFLPGWSKLN